MKGTMLIIGLSGSIKTVPLAEVPELETLQREVGGWLEKVPGFDSIDYHGSVRPCVALCNEEGKLKHMVVNQGATRMWAAALQRRGLGPVGDVLVGKIIIIFGDRELMGAL